MATKILNTDTKAAPDQLVGYSHKVSAPMPRHGSDHHVPVPPDHRSEQARRRSEADQAAIDIAAGW
jgi:hypothetical protein